MDHILLQVNPLPDNKILDRSKLKQSAEDNFEFDVDSRKFSKLVENTVGKGEIARYEQFLLYPQCFLKACLPAASKGVIVWELVINSFLCYQTSVNRKGIINCKKRFSVLQKKYIHRPNVAKVKRMIDLNRVIYLFIYLCTCIYLQIYLFICPSIYHSFVYSSIYTLFTGK